MITKPLVLVLGAGASKPYGFPLGSELREDICSLEVGVKSLLGTYIYKTKGIAHQDLVSFGEAFRWSNQRSIDRFLALREEYVEVGKIAIAASLLSKKSEDFLDHQQEDEWYQELWAALQSNASKVEDIKNNKIKIITFNYDLSLEAYLLLSIKHSFGVSDETALTTLKHIPILHVYGSLGKFGSGEDSKPYQNDMSTTLLTIAANEIKIIPEQRSDDPSFLTAQEWFKDATNICFLGFGFDALNVERLGLKTLIIQMDKAGMQKPSFTASTFGMTRAEVTQAKNRLGVDNYLWHPISAKNLETIREHIYILN